MTHSNVSLDNDQSLAQSTDLVLDMEDDWDSVQSQELKDVGPPPVVATPRERNIHKVKGKPG